MCIVSIYPCVFKNVFIIMVMVQELIVKGTCILGDGFTLHLLSMGHGKKNKEAL